MNENIGKYDTLILFECMGIWTLLEPSGKLVTTKNYKQIDNAESWISMNVHE